MTSKRAKLVAEIWKELAHLQRATETPEQRFERLTDEKRDLLDEIHGTFGHKMRAGQYKRLSEIEEELAKLEPVLIALDAIRT